MAMRSTARRWTVATWLVAGVGDETAALGEAIAAADVDVIVLQNLRERTVQAVCAALDFRHAWEVSHHPRSRLIPGSALGLAVLTPHSVASSTSVPVTEQTSLWSSNRRIAQVALVERADRTGFAVAHAVGSLSTRLFESPSNAPTVRVHPAQVGVDGHRVIELPDGATLVETTSSSPVDGAGPLVTATFDMPWVDGDLPPT